MTIAVDTNFIVGLAGGDEETVEAHQTLGSRCPQHRRLVTPTVLLETRFLSRQTGDLLLRRAATIALRKLTSEWQIDAGFLSPVQHGIAEQVAREIRWRGLLPQEEKHDSLIIAEAALLNAILLVTNDSLLRGLERLTLELVCDHFDLRAPIIATPREIVRHFNR